MARELFGTDGVRGPAGVYPLDFEGTEAIGRAAGTHFAEPGDTILIGHDPRESSPEIVEGLAAGMTAVGVNVEVIGTIPTPGLALTTREHNVAAGAMVTASHNPYRDNGIKIFDHNGGKLTDDTEGILNDMITGGVPDRGYPGQRKNNSRGVTEYEDFLVASAGGASFDGLRIGLDAGNGAASGIAHRVFERLGADVVAIGDKPDGRNINDGVGATHPDALQQAVIENGLDMGAAFDGDADRIIMVDGNGEQFNGDKIMYTLAKARGEGLVVATQMTNLGTEQAMAREGISLDRRGVGDRYVLEGLRETGANIGGEQSGHIILPELLATGDGMLAAVQMVKAVRESGLTLAEWSAEVHQLPQSLVNIPVADKRLLNHPEVQALIAAKGEEMNGNGRLLIRPSGTEPKARVMVESDDAFERAEAYAAELKQLLTRLTA